MDSKILEKTYKLKESILQSKEYKKMIRLSSLMDENDEVIKLAYTLDILGTKYSDILKIYNKDSLEAQKVQKELYEAKKQIDNHPLVREYNKAYLKVKEMYDYINKNIFNKF